MQPNAHEQTDPCWSTGHHQGRRRGCPGWPLLDLAHGALQRIADVGRHGTHIVSAAVVWHLETMGFGEQGQFGIARVGDNLFVFFVPNIPSALEEQ